MPENSDCVETTLARNKAGYGAKRARLGGRWSMTTHHRWVYAQHHGLTLDEMKGWVVMHSCDNPPCINVDHLVLATQRENMDDMVRKSREARGAKLNHPPQGGELNHAAKVTEAQVREIRSRHAAGERQSDLMREFGLTRSNVWAIVHRKSWPAVGFDTAAPALIADFSRGF